MNTIIQTISAADCHSQIENASSSYLVDVRMPAEFEQTHIDGAKLFPLDQLNAKELTNQLNLSENSKLYVICHSGGRAKKACEKLHKQGIKNVVQVEGGIQAWEAANLPVIKTTRKIISLQRQVQIAAGSLIVIGFLLSLFIHPWLIGLSVFVGCGLIFAGISDTCGMAVLLSKMPWNKPKNCKQNCSCSIN